jgi:dihydroorotase
MLRENVTIIDNAGTKNVLIEMDDSGTILSMQKSDVTPTKLLMPLMVDLNVSTLNESFESQALQKLANHALDNGVGSIVLRPFSKDPINTQTQLSSIYAYLDNAKGAKIFPAFCVIKDETHLSNIATLLAAGGVIPYIYSDMDSNLMRRVMQYASMKKVALFCDLRDRSLNADAVMNEGSVSAELGLVGNTPLAELVQVSKVMEMAHYFDVEIVIKGISTVAVLDKIMKAKADGVRVKAEVSIHHLIISDEACRAYNTCAKIEPPLRSYSETKAMQEALKMDKIDMLTSMHTPQSKLRKETAFSNASVGTEGLTAIFSLYYTKLVKTGLISLDKLYELTVATPSKYTGNSLDSFNVGSSMGSMLIDLEQEVLMENSESLYYEQKLQSKVIYTTL